MKIVHIIPGSGGTFYCQNCMRDNELIRALRDRGHDVIMVPMYLPLNVDVDGLMGDTPVFYGAINVYLKEKLPFYRHAPEWMERLLDSESMLQFAAKKAGSTRASGLEEMTISMLLGEEGRQASELEHLIEFLNRHVKPDVVHLSNALLLGLARRLKQDVGAGVVCSLQDENEWIDPMQPSYQEQVWDLMAERAHDVDAFIAASHYYAEKSIRQMRLPAEKVHVVYGGICFDGYEQATLDLRPPAIGYLCRMSEYFGLGLVTDAFILLKQDARFKDLKFYATGGYTDDDKPFVDNMKKKLHRAGLLDDVEFWPEFDKPHRIQFLKKLSLLSVPVLVGEAFGAYQVEALAAGVPIVQPNVGGYREFIEQTSGGIIYEPNDSEHLANAISSLLLDPEKLRKLGRDGRNVVLERFSMRQMAEAITRVYAALPADRRGD
ncbi:glycosyltransferase family 4 protein [candidate division KSB1 bacterium]|nr:glycosyltransferase family 4 protein [candidate division KSB1 bacterium]